MSKASEDLKQAADKAKEAVQDVLHGEGAAAKAALAEAGNDVVQAVKDVEGAVKDAVVAQVERARGFFKTVFGHPLHDPSQAVTVTSEGVEAEHTDWVQGQIEAGTIVKVEAAAPVEAAPAAPAAPAPEAK